jgi:Heavy-metal resistance protein CzcE
MKAAVRPLAAAAVLATSALYFAGASAAVPDPKGWNGTPVTQGRVDRVVEISPTTRVVNVDENQIVKFVVHESGGRDESFMWQFNGARAVIPLSAIAPDGVVAHPVNVYVGPDPLEGSMAE